MKNQMSLSNKNLFLALILGIFFIFSFAITHGTSVIVEHTREPTTVDSIKLYTRPPNKYEEIAIVSSDSAHDFLSKQKLMDIAVNRLKEEAAKVGANGINYF